LRVGGWLLRGGLLGRLVVGGGLFLACSVFSGIGFVGLVALLAGALLRRGLLGRSGAFFVRFDRGFEFLAGHFPLGHFGLVEQEVADLIFVKRGAKLGLGHRIAADVFHEPLTILGAVLLRGLLDQHAH